MRKRLTSLRTFYRALNIGGYFSRRPYFNFLTRMMMRLLADLTIWLKKGEEKEELEEIAQEWQRMFPGRRMVPIREIDENTAFAEVHALCPVTDTGDVQACYRLMEYDRRLLEHIGGEFVVLKSQASPEVTACQVAIRKKGALLNDLTPAHQKSVADG